MVCSRIDDVKRYCAASFTMLAILLGPRPALAQCLPTFGAPAQWVGPFNIRYVVTDLNHDSKSDLVVSAAFTNAFISVYLGVGDGTFSYLGNVPAGNVAGALADGDLNGDGSMDIAVVNNTSNDVSILLGNGDGTFQPVTYLAAGDTPFSIAIGDLNDDGRLDLVVGNFHGNTVLVFIGNGDGSFQSAVSYPVSAATYDVALADLNNDGKLDAVFAVNSNIAVFLGNGDGTLQPAVNYSAGASPVNLRDLAVGDINRDGKLDLTSANQVGKEFRLFLGNGDGTLQPPVSVTLCSSCSLRSTAIGDVNGDNRLDVITGNNSVDQYVSLGNGDGTFQSPITFSLGNILFGEHVSIADLNSDNRPDVILGGHGLDVVLNTSPSIGLNPQPTDQAVLSGQNATITVGAIGTGPFTYQWRRNGQPLSNGGHFAGARTNTLSIGNVSETETGAYDVVVSGGCNGSIGANSKLAILSLQVCRGDFNGDKQFDGADIQQIVDALLSGVTCP